MISSLFYLVTIIFSITALATDSTELGLTAVVTLLVALVATIRER